MGLFPNHNQDLPPEPVVFQNRGKRSVASDERAITGGVAYMYLLFS